MYENNGREKRTYILYVLNCSLCVNGYFVCYQTWIGAVL